MVCWSHESSAAIRPRSASWCMCRSSSAQASIDRRAEARQAGSRPRQPDRRGRRPLRATAAPTKSRNSGCGPVGPRLELGMELAGAEPRVVRQLDDLDQPLVRRRARDDQAVRDELRAQGVVDLVAVAVALVDHRLAVGPRRRRCPRPPSPGRSPAASCRPCPRPASARAGGRSPGRPSRRRTRSSWRPRGRPRGGRTRPPRPACPGRRPRNGTDCSRANRTAAILPSMPRTPNPPGMRMPSTCESRRSASAQDSVSASTQTISSLVPWWMAACLSASTTDR